MSKAAVLRSLGSPDSRRGYQHAIDEFVAWYCSEPRLAFNKTVVLRYRIFTSRSGPPRPDPTHKALCGDLLLRLPIVAY